MALVQNTFRADRHGTPPEKPATWPDPPEFLVLSARQREIWAGLKDKDCWHAETDWPAVYGLVKSIDELMQNHAAQQETETSGHPLAFKHMLKHSQDERGQPIEVEYVLAEGNPLKSEARKFLDQLYKFATINGYTPVDRGRMPQAADLTVKNPLDRWINKRSA